MFLRGRPWMLAAATAGFLLACSARDRPQASDSPGSGATPVIQVWQTAVAVLDAFGGPAGLLERIAGVQQEDGSVAPGRRPFFAEAAGIPAWPARLYFNGAELNAIRQAVAAEASPNARRLLDFGLKMERERGRTLPPVDEGTLSRTAGSWRVHGDRLLGVAGAYMVADDADTRGALRDWCLASMTRLTDYGRWAPRGTLRSLDPVHILLGFAVAYDFLYPSLNETQRIKFGEELRSHAEAEFVATQQRSPATWVRGYAGNHNVLHHNALLHAALTLQPRYPEQTARWLEQVVVNTERVMELRAMRGDGADHEGVMYATYADHGLFPTLHLLARHGIADHFDNPWLQQHFTFLLFGSRPGLESVLDFSDGHGSFGHGPQHLLRFLDALMHDGRPSWVADFLRDRFGREFPFGKPEGATLLHEFLWTDPSVEPRPLQAGGGLAVFHDWGVAAFTRGWGPEATSIAFRSGEPGGRALWGLARAGDARVPSPRISHAHPDAGGFSFHPGGSPFVSGGGYQKPKRTALNNSYTFTPAFPLEARVGDHRIDRFWDRDRINDVGRPQEIGQSGEWGTWFGPPEELLRHGVALGPLETTADNGVFFASAEFAGAYPPSIRPRGQAPVSFGLQSLRRSLLLLPEDVLIVADRVRCSERLAVHCWFRSRSTADYRPHWRLIDASAILPQPLGRAHQLDVIYPTGLKREVGREVVNIEEARGSNRRGVRDWDRVLHYSTYLRISHPGQTGDQHYLYLLRPAGRAAKVSELQVHDAGLSFQLLIEKSLYQIKIGTSEDTEAVARWIGGPDRLSLLRAAPSGG